MRRRLLAGLALLVLGATAYALTRAATRERPLTVPYQWVGAA